MWCPAPSLLPPQSLQCPCRVQRSRPALCSTGQTHGHQALERWPHREDPVVVQAQHLCPRQQPGHRPSVAITRKPATGKPWLPHRRHPPLAWPSSPSPWASWAWGGVPGGRVGLPESPAQEHHILSLNLRKQLPGSSRSGRCFLLGLPAPPAARLGSRALWRSGCGPASPLPGPGGKGSTACSTDASAIVYVNR